MRYAYLDATHLQKQIYYADINNPRGSFELIWSWLPNNSITVDHCSKLLSTIIEKYEILRTTLVEENGVIKQKIAESISDSQISGINQSSEYFSPSLLKSISAKVHGCCFILQHDNSNLVHSIYGVANHSTIDAASIEYLRFELCQIAVNICVDDLAYELQFADIVDSLDSLEHDWTNLDDSEFNDELTNSIHSISLDANRDQSVVWYSSDNPFSLISSSSNSSLNLTTLAQFFQHLISKIGLFLNKPFLKVGVALDARNFIDIGRMIGPALLVRKGCVDIRKLSTLSQSNELNNFLYESKISTDSSSLFSQTTNYEVLFNLIIHQPSDLNSLDVFTSSEYCNDSGANVPITIDCRFDVSLSHFSLFLRSNSESIDLERLANIGNFLLDQSTSISLTPNSCLAASELNSLILSSFESFKHKKCISWTTSDGLIEYLFEDIYKRVRFYQLFLIKSKVSNSYVLVRCLDPFEYLASILALVLTGNIYIPLDERRNNETVRVNLIQSIAHYELRPPVSSDSSPDLIDFNNPLVIRRDDHDDDVCLMFTSGSTGIPKGVRITRRGLLRLYELGRQKNWSQSSFLMHSDIGFDASLFEIWIPLLSGGHIKCVHHLKLMSDGICVDVDCCWLSVSMLTQILKNTNNILRAKSICTGGEHVPYSLVRSVEKSGFFVSGNRLFNGYGPTESTTFIFLDQIDPISYQYSEGVLSSLLPFTHVSLRNFLNDECSVGSVGELYVSGDGVANGYLSSSSNSDFFRDKSGNFFYKTGDFFQRVSNSCFKFIGRADDQLKISGYRVSLEQIRNNLLSFFGTCNVIVIKNDMDGKISSTAFVEISSSITQSYINSRVELMRKCVPHYLIPKVIIPLKELPLSINGKVDREQLAIIYSNFIISNNQTSDTYLTMEEIISCINSSMDFESDFDISHLSQDSLSLVTFHARLIETGFDINIHDLSNCFAISDLLVLLNVKNSITTSLSHSDNSSASLPLVLHTSLEVDHECFDLVNLSCFFTSLFNFFDHKLTHSFSIFESSLSAKDYLPILIRKGYLLDFPLCCTYSISATVTINLFCLPHVFSIFALDALILCARDFLVYKGTPFARISRFRTFIHSELTNNLVNDLPLDVNTLFNSIRNSIAILRTKRNQRILALLPVSSAPSVCDSLFDVSDGITRFEGEIKSSDFLFLIENIYSRTKAFNLNLGCKLIKGALQNDQLIWQHDEVSLSYSFTSPSLLAGSRLSFKSPPLIWKSNADECSATTIVIISPVADDLLPILPLSKLLASKGLSVIAIAYGLLSTPSDDSVDSQAERIVDLIDIRNVSSFIGYSYSGILVNFLLSHFCESHHKGVIIDTPNPALLHKEFSSISTNDSTYWFKQVCIRLLKSVDISESLTLKVLSNIEESQLSIVDLIGDIRYMLIELKAIPYSTAIDDLLCWIEAAQAQFKLFRDYSICNNSNLIVFLKASLDLNHPFSELSWDDYCPNLRVVNVNANHYSIVKSSTINQYIDCLLEEIL